MTKDFQFAHLHSHTDHSSLDGHASVKELARHVYKTGQVGFAVTDHGTMSNIYNGWKAAKEIREEYNTPFYFVPGIEAYVAPGDAHRSTREAIFFSNGSREDKTERSNDVSGGGAYTHMTLLGETTEGMHNLFRLNTLAWHEGIHRKPRMDIESISTYSKGIIATTGCPSGELQTRLRLGQWNEAIKYASKMQDIFGKENYFLELMDHNMSIDLERRVRGDLMKVGKELGIPLLATNDLHYVHREDAKDHEHMLCLQSGSSMMDKPYDLGGKRFAFEGEEYYAKETHQMLKLFPHEDYPFAVQNAAEIAMRSTAEFKYNPDLRPSVPLPDGHDEHSYLREIVYEGLRRKRPDKVNDQEYIDRIEKELGVLKEKNFSGYMLVVSDFTRWAKAQGWRVGPGRGCLSGDTMIPTTLGSKRLDEINVGDYIFDQNGETVEIPTVFEWDCDEELIAVSTYFGGDVIKMTADHHVLVAKHVNGTLSDPEWIRADEIMVGDSVMNPVLQFPDTFEGLEFSNSGEIKVAEPNWNLGFVLGSILTAETAIGENAIHFPQGTSENFGSIFENSFGVNLSIDDSDGHFFTEHSGILRMLKTLFGVLDSSTVSIPPALMHSNANFRSGLANGIYLNDGTRFATASRNLAYDTMTLASTFGWRVNVDAEESGYVVTLDEDFPRITETPEGRFIANPVTHVDVVPAEGKVYDFRVDTTHSYVTESFIVHNSGGGSSVAFFTDITEIDPIPHGLIFERFLNPERDSPPDIDSDFDEHREEVIEYVRQKYGEEMVSMIITIGVIKAKSAIKDMARIYEEPYSVGEILTKALPKPVAGKEISLREAFDPEAARYDEAEGFREEVKKLENKNLIPYALGIEGKMRQWGVHAAGVIMSKTPIKDSIPLMMRAKDKVTITQFDYPTCEDLGLIKMDFLGLRNLTVINKCIKAIEKNHGIVLIPEEIYDSVLDNPDQKTFDIINSGRTIGIFQLDSADITSLARLIHVTEFNDISAILALYRPGPMGMNSHINYADRKNGRAPITPIHPDLDEALNPILAETFQVICYQEQIQFIAQKVAGYSLGRADILRRAMGKKKKSILDAEFIPFSEGMRANGYKDDAIDALWETLIPFAEYGFNKSHSAGYALISYLTAYLKANYGAEFMAANLSTMTDDKEKTAIYLQECRQMGITVLPPDVSLSTADYTATKDGTILVGLEAIRGVGHEVAESLNREVVENGKFANLDDFLARAPSSTLSKTALEGFAHSGALDGFGYSRRAMHKSLPEVAIGFAKAKKKQDSGQFSLFDMVEESESPKADIVDLPEYIKKDKLMFERHALGLYVSDHPLSGIANMLERFCDTQTIDILSGAEKPSGGGFGDRKTLRLAGVANSVIKKPTRKGGMFATFELEDISGSIPCLIFPKAYERLGDKLFPDNIYQISGSLLEGDSEDDVKFAVDTIEEIALTESGQIPFEIQLGLSQAGEEALQELQTVLLQSPGEMPVHLIVRRADGSSHVYELDESLKVAPSNELVQNIRMLFGVRAVI